MNNDSEWFREGMVRCSEDHKRVRKTWSRFIMAVWILLSGSIGTSILFMFIHAWGSAGMMLGWSVFIGWKLKDSYEIREELCDLWLKQRDAYSREYESRK